MRLLTLQDSRKESIIHAAWPYDVQWNADGCWCAALSFGLTWEAQADKPALGSYYLDLGDKLNAVCPSCIFLLEGTGQSKFLGVDWCLS